MKEKKKYSVLIASPGDKLYDFMAGLLPPGSYELLPRVTDAGSVRRSLMHQTADIIIIDTPLPDDFGMDLAMDLTETPAAIILMVKAEMLDQVSYKVEDAGVLCVGKPNNRQGIYTAVKLATAVSARLAKTEKKARSLEEKITDIRTSNRAKWLLISNCGMTEEEAHRYIEKEAMSTRKTARQVAEMIISDYTD